MTNLPSVKHKNIVLLPQDVDGLHFICYMGVKDESFQLDVYLACKTSLREMRFHCDWKLRELLRGFEEALEKRMEQCQTLYEFVEELKMLTEKLMLSEISTNSVATVTAGFLSEIFGEFQRIGWHRVAFVNEEFNVVKVMSKDRVGRTHILAFYMNSKVTGSDFSCSVDLPVFFNKENGENMTRTYRRFTKVVESCQSLWDVFRGIDESCWTIQTENTSYGTLSRRIALGNNSFLQIVLDPHQSNAMPECRFLGPSRVIDPVKETLNKNMHLWDARKSVIDNFSSVLQIVFPLESSTNSKKLFVDCGICYTYQLDDFTPEYWCNDSKCGQMFHKSCLTEWLKSSSYQQSFNVIFGECPYCGKGCSYG